MAIFRYLSEVDSQGEEMLTAEVIKEMIGLDVVQVLKLFLEYMRKYPELLEFPNGIQNLMTLFYSEIQYDINLLKEVMFTLVQTFNIVMAKDQFL